MRPREPDTNYPLLLITIIIGVTLGNLLSNFISAKVIEYQSRQAAIELNQTLQVEAQKMQAAAVQASQQNEVRMAENLEALRQQRAKDAIGIKLSQNCAEWRRADANLNSYTTHAEFTKSCNRYEQYLQTGQIESPR